MSTAQLQLTYDHLYFCYSKNGRGVHILKPGSKRRRRRPEIEESLNWEAASQIDNEALQTKLRQQQQEIEELKSEVQESARKVAEGEFAINWVNSQRSKGRISISKNGVPNIIGNESDEEDDSEIPMWAWSTLSSDDHQAIDCSRLSILEW